ncbi:MAG: methyltransferase domain-containing protein [Bacteroidota bacterium]
MKVGQDNDSNRVQWIIDALKKVPSGSRILDAGAGELRFKQHCSHLNYVAQDFGQYDGSGDAGLQTGSWDQTKLDIVSDITAIPEPDNSFDAILCVEVFEHIPDPLAALREFKRLLKPGGYLIITAPFASITHFAPYFFYSGFSRYFYETHLANNGFEITELKLNGNYFDYLAQELRRINFVAAKYTGQKQGLIGKAGVQLLLWSLTKLSSKGKNSSELLSYGCQVFARKK